ncbi:hypothetical protein [Sulfuricaulis sp.]|jgi:hypothetical protein|uniref:hypothetical protein n=1 Tax=Sulfuricaulis sp. TaxID=2003553 RepID=UPI003559A3FA
MHVMRLVGLLFFLLAAGCVGVERAPPPTGAPPAEAAAVEPSKIGSTGQGVAKVESQNAKTPAKLPAEQPRKQSATPSSGKPGTPPLDLTALETRLKETKAIGVFTKITLKNQVDDLLSQFRAYYQGRVKTTLAELRQPYDMLLLKVLSLLQDGDPELARAIVASREAIWGILADPAKFATL